MKEEEEKQEKSYVSNSMIKIPDNFSMFSFLFLVKVKGPWKIINGKDLKFKRKQKENLKIKIQFKKMTLPEVPFEIPF